MMRTVLFALCILWSPFSNSQTPKFPHPLIFVHGIVSNDATWNQTVTALGGNAKIFDVCLNHDGNNQTSSLTSSDVLPIGWRDGITAPSPNRLYVINFDHSRFQASGHTTHALSNQAAIFKQGKALGAMIQAVLSLENSRGVILIGHSMGGLAIREYLQRGFNGDPAGRGTNWVDQSSPSGHRVVRVVTTGTPHLGSNHTGLLLSAIAGVDERSEACRDLRFPYSAGFPVPATIPAPFLFGGQENMFQWSVTPHNLDVNCNGTTGDQIVGLNTSTTFNGTMPLPANIRYTWITSNLSGSGQDLLVETARQWLSSGSTPTPSTADTLLLGINHMEEPGHAASIIRGMDEPADTALAYDLKLGQMIKGFVTYGPNWSTIDRDVFRITMMTTGTLEIWITDLASGVDSLIVFSSAGEVVRSSAGQGTTAVQVNHTGGSNAYYAAVRGSATADSYLHPYTLHAASRTTAVDQPSNLLPSRVGLQQNYPNPFNPGTRIGFWLATENHVTLKVRDLLGREIMPLIDGRYTKGEHTVYWDGKDIHRQAVPSGIYLYTLSAGSDVSTRMMTLLR